MEYIVLDLEWNGAFSKKAHGYFNEIIEIGATRMDERGCPQDGFEVLIHPVVSRKLTHFVTDLTGLESETLQDGDSFEQAMLRLQQWIGSKQALILTWSTTDLLVLLENFRYFLQTDRIPFMSHYMDAQAYFQRQSRQMEAGRQIGLAKAGELCEISLEGMDMHRARDDSRLTARIVEHVWEANSFAESIRPADEEFYKRLTFKARVASSITDPLVKKEHLCFSCPTCNRALRQKGTWRFYGQMLCSEMVCESCAETYTARVQVKQRYEDVAVKRKLTKKKPPEEPEKTIQKGEDCS